MAHFLDKDFLADNEMGRFMRIWTSYYNNDDIMIDAETGCHLWTKVLTHDGYGRIHLTVNTKTGGTVKKDVMAHVLGFNIENQKVKLGKKGFVVSHLCGVKHCVYFKHLSYEPIKVCKSRQRCIGHCTKEHSNYPECVDHPALRKALLISRKCKTKSKKTENGFVPFGVEYPALRCKTKTKKKESDFVPFASKGAVPPRGSIF